MFLGVVFQHQVRDDVYQCAGLEVQTDSESHVALEVEVAEAGVCQGVERGQAAGLPVLGGGVHLAQNSTVKVQYIKVQHSTLEYSTVQ